MIGPAIIGSITVPRVWFPESEEEKRRGLLGRSGMGDDEGVWYQGNNITLHTVGMQFSIDIVWLDSLGGIVAADENIPPGVPLIEPKSGYCVELAGGWVSRYLRR